MDTLGSVSNAIVLFLRDGDNRNLHEGDAVPLPDPLPEALKVVEEVSFLAQKGYNTVWLVKLRQSIDISSAVLERFVLRLPCSGSLMPNQLTNDVAFKQFVASSITLRDRVPVPRVYQFKATNDRRDSFVAEEFIEGATLSSVWMNLSFSQKEKLARDLARITVDLASTQFDMIGGLDPATETSPTPTAAPTVEGAKMTKKRSKFHDPKFYPLGPYRSTKEYILACYEKEIVYYSQAPRRDINTKLFKGGILAVPFFVEKLREKRAELSETDIRDEPFVLCHGDFHGRNILVNGEGQEIKITAVTDWDFAGSYPLSETLSWGGIDVLDADTDPLYAETMDWNKKICGFVREEAESRGGCWDRERVRLLMSDGSREVAKARIAMFPSYR